MHRAVIYMSRSWKDGLVEFKNRWTIFWVLAGGRDLVSGSGHGIQRTHQANLHVQGILV